jgi:hypothetical protein
MADAAGVLVLVTMLATFACARKPNDLDIGIANLDRAYGRCPGQDSNGDSAGVDPVTFLGRWNTLKAVSSCFKIQTGQVLSGDPEGRAFCAKAKALDISTAAVAEFDVGLRHVVDEQKSVRAAFARIDLNRAFHRISP